MKTEFKMVPDRPPQQTEDETKAYLKAAGVDLTKPALLGVRGYYRNTMGEKGVNDLGIYDDAIFYRDDSNFLAFNANCDPARHHPGVATLKPGLWVFKLGIHGLSKPKVQQYRALVQACPFVVLRQKENNPKDLFADEGYFGINLHRGSFKSVSSEGCQTIHPAQWVRFITMVQFGLKKYKVPTIPYVLIENKR